MKIEELKAILQLSADRFEMLQQEFSKVSPAGNAVEFLEFLHEHEIIAESDYLQAKAERVVEINYSGAEVEAAQKGPLPGLSLKGVLGEGAMGAVHLARDVALKRNVALKVIKGDAALDRSSQSLFVREIMITAQLDHPNIVPIYSMENASDGSMGYTMKLVRGRTLDDIISDAQSTVGQGRDDGMPLEERLEIFLKVCDAIGYAHARGVLHRDLKPSNVMIGPFGEVYVMDWGIAKVLDGNPDLEEDGALVGTISHISPEQAKGHLSSLGPASDQYALGLILQEVTTLRRAIPDGTLVDMVRRARRGQRAPVIHFSPKNLLRPELVAIIAKSTHRDPDERYASVEDLADDLRRFLREEPVLARPDPFFAKIQRWIYRHRSLAIGLFLVVMILGLLSNLVNLHLKQQEREAALAREHEQKEQALIRERAMVHLLTSVSAQGQAIDQHFLSYQGLLRGLAASAELRLQTISGPSDGFYLNQDFSDASTAPSDLVFSERYNRKISLDHPVIKLAPGVGQDSVLPRIHQLALLQNVFRNTLLRSHDENSLASADSKLREQILEKGTPVVWVYVAAEEGIHAAYPGKGGYKEDYDPRKRPWYSLSKGEHGPVCGNPYVDAMGQGLLLPCTMSLYSEAQDLIGVAGLEFTFKYIADELLDLPGFQESEVLMVDEEGRVIISSSDTETSDGGQVSRPLFPVQKVVSDILKKESGYYMEWSIEGEQLIVYHRMQSMGWYYVVKGSSGSLIYQNAPK
jgi:eukaryotic-like serine/threonine-protein kinase